MSNACLLVSKTTYEVWNIYCDNESRDEIVTYCFDRITNKELPHKSNCPHGESYSLSPTDNGYHFTWWRNE